MKSLWLFLKSCSFLLFTRRKEMPTIEISNETFEKIKDQLDEGERLDINELKDLIGKSLFLRTVTYHIIGKVYNVTGTILWLKQASWVADSGRFMDAIKYGTLKEVEPVGSWFVNISTVTDGGPWVHPLPTEQI
jgi:hypothetical protein